VSFRPGECPAQYGPEITTRVADMVVGHRVPVHRSTILVIELFGMQVSTAFAAGLRGCAATLIRAWIPGRSQVDLGLSLLQDRKNCKSIPGACWRDSFCSGNFLAGRSGCGQAGALLGEALTRAPADSSRDRDCGSTGRRRIKERSMVGNRISSPEQAHEEECQTTIM
jgi:hypothetical protein